MNIENNDDLKYAIYVFVWTTYVVLNAPLDSIKIK